MSADPIDALLSTTDLDGLMTAVDALPADADTARIGGVVEAWADPQGVANVLMHPSVIPSSHRVAAVLRGLRSEGYLRLAATVGVGHLSPTELPDGVRRELLDALLDVVASDAGPAGVRASAEIGPLLLADEVELLDDLAAHPVDAVRHNLTQAGLGVTAPDAREPVLLPYLPDYAEYLDAR
ncbi:hypothetical protein GCM10023350_53730 [Nocardioides endophyticus]|uniref:Uncharacterized protein n=1 Tax=Nocardioides endophyticus TaxID=1353775 RepID=A0ABP8ZN83_9ACTN